MRRKIRPSRSINFFQNCLQSSQNCPPFSLVFQTCQVVLHICFFLTSFFSKYSAQAKRAHCTYCSAVFSLLLSFLVLLLTAFFHMMQKRGSASRKNHKTFLPNTFRFLPPQNKRNCAQNYLQQVQTTFSTFQNTYQMFLLLRALHVLAAARATATARAIFVITLVFVHVAHRFLTSVRVHVDQRVHFVVLAVLLQLLHLFGLV